MSGVAPVIGPHWDNFKWVGPDLFRQNLVRQVANGPAGVDRLLKDLQAPAPRERVASAAMAFIRRQQGGTERACRLIEEYLHGDLFGRG